MTDPQDFGPIGLGTSGNDDHDECIDTVERALAAGYRHLDTAQMYGNEALVGAGLRLADVDRDDVVLATKVHPDNLAAEDVRETTERSLARLGVDRIDLLYVHWPISAYDPEATLAAVDDLHDSDLVDAVGLSNFTPALLDEARSILDAPVVAHQVECHPLLPQEELRAYARRHGHALVAYSPLGGGELLDDPTLTEIAEKHDVGVAAVCLSYLAALETVVPIPKATGDHVETNRAALELELDQEDVAAIEAIDRRERVVDPDPAPWN